MEQKIIDATKYFQSLFGELIKDLHETDEYKEELCEHCKGTGLTLYDNPYGLSEEKRVGVLFPYKHQAIGFCPHCYNGVVRRCKRCGELIPRGWLKHNCPEQRKVDEEKKEKEEKNFLDSLREATAGEIAGQRMLYSEYYPYNEGYFEDFDEFFDTWESEHEDEDPKPEFCFGTDTAGFSIDAESIVENACEDLYEGAFEDCSHIDELQSAIDDWAKKYGPGDSYCYHRRFKIRIPWENFKKS